MKIPNCVMCSGEIDLDDSPPRAVVATHMVGGYALCTDHAVREAAEIIRNPETFLHSGLSLTDDHDSVPYSFEVRLLDAVELKQVAVSRLVCPTCGDDIIHDDPMLWRVREGTYCEACKGECTEPFDHFDPPELIADLVCPFGHAWRPVSLGVYDPLEPVED